MKTLCFVITFLFSISENSSAQVDSNLLFQKTKGTWQYPIRTGTMLGPNTHGYPGKKATFIAKKSDSVFAIYSGQAVSIENIDSAYLVITKYKDYFISYYGLTTPLIKLGDIVIAGQHIGNLAEDLEGLFSLDIFLNKNSDDLDVHLWFKY